MRIEQMRIEQNLNGTTTSINEEKPKNISKKEAKSIAMISLNSIINVLLRLPEFYVVFYL
jgi:hypothetical protein